MSYSKIRGSKYYYELQNADKPETVLLVHGHPFDHTMWKYQIEDLKDFRLILPDLKGYGKTDFQFDKIFIEEQALDLALLLDELQIEKVHLIGLSMGGQIIIEFARLFPHRSKSLIICDSNPAAETEASYKVRQDLIQRMLLIGMNEYTNQDIYKYLHPETNEKQNEAYKHLYQMMTDTKLAGAIAAHKGRAERRDNLINLGKIDLPALILVGDKDFFTPVSEMEVVASKLKNSKLAVIENAGHMPNMEQPEAFNKAVKTFYAEIKVNRN